LFEIKHGYAFKGQHFATSGKYLLLTPGNFKVEGGLKLKGEGEKYYGGDFPREFLLGAGDLLVAMTDLTQEAPILGSPLLVPEDKRFLHNQRLGKIVKVRKDRVTHKFLFYLFCSPLVRAQIKASASGATVRHTSPSRIGEVRALLPSISVQKTLVDVLSAYDDLVANNFRRVQILEQMCRDVYREWFVELRAPGVANSLVGLPFEWRRVPLREAVWINPKVVVPRDGEKPFVPMGCLSNDSMIIDGVESRTGNSGSKFQNGDTLFARITPCLENGKTAFVQFLPDAESVAFGSTEFIVLRSKTLTPEFVYLMARSDEVRGPAIKSMSGASGRQRVQEQCFDTMTVVQPSPEVLARFTEVVRPMFRLVHQLHLQNVNLGATRDLLLPRLMSGQLRLAELEADPLVAAEPAGAGG
jgi:type I restriction enzyme S subunit